MKKYTILEEETGIHLGPSSLYRAWSRHDKIVGKSVRNFLFYRKKDRYKWCGYLNEFLAAGKAVLKKILKDRKFANNISDGVRKNAKKLNKFSNNLLNQNLHNKSNDEFAQIITHYIKILEDLYYWGLFIEAMEVYHGLFSKYLQEKLEHLTKKKNLTRVTGEYFAILTTSDEISYAANQEKEFFIILSKIKTDKKIKNIFAEKGIVDIIKDLKNDKLNQIINKHLKNYCWVNYNYEGPEMSKKTLINLLKQAIINNIDPEEKLAKIKENIKNNKMKQRESMEELNPDNQLKRLLDLAKEFSALKMVRKESIYFSYYAIDKIRKEFCQRFGITLNQSRCLNEMEFIDVLKSGKIDRKKLLTREKELAQLVENGVERIYSGNQAQKISKRIIEKKVDKNIRMIIGTCASPGSAKGIVRIISSINEMQKMKEGDILVAMATNPSLVSAMKKANAIITDILELRNINNK